MSKAVIKYLRLSPTKARLIARQIQGMNAELAMASLKFMPNKGAKFIASAISSAVANGGFEANEVEVVSCRVDAGAVLKRFQPRARGSASRIRKPSSHILVVVEKTEEKAKKSTKKSENSNKATNETKNSSQKAKNSSQNSTKASENVAKAVNSKENSNKAVNSSEKKAENSNKNVNSSEAKVENSSKAVSEDKKAENSSSENSKTAKGEAKKAPARAKKSETKED